STNGARPSRWECRHRGMHYFIAGKESPSDCRAANGRRLFYLRSRRTAPAISYPIARLIESKSNLSVHDVPTVCIALGESWIESVLTPMSFFLSSIALRICHVVQTLRWLSPP